MAKGRPMGSPQRTTRIPIRGAKLEVADRLLAAAKDNATLYDSLTIEQQRIPWWKFRAARRCKTLRWNALLRYMQAITAAQDLANKRVGNRDDMTPNW